MSAWGRRHFIGAGIAATAAAAGGPAFAQAFPSKQIRWVIPFAPGGNYDVTARIVADPMARQLGQGVLIDNKPGAGGVVGLELAYNAPADGYTIVMASFTVGYVAPIFAGKKEMLSQFAPVSILTTVPTLVVTRADSRFTDMKSVVAECRAKPGTVSIGHSGNGTTNHVGILRLQLNDDLKFNVIPYRGSGPGLADLLAGYETAGGGRIDPDDARTWIVYGSLKWGVMCMSMYQGFLRDHSVERAAIGRRSSETEVDLINLIIRGKI